MSACAFRLGTWNLQGRWDERHLDLLNEMNCDILLLTEVSDRIELPGWQLHPTAALMARRRHWSAIASRSTLEPLPDPHGAAALAVVDGLVVCSSVLPWRTCGARPPWSGSTTAERTIDAVDAIAAVRPTVWGGDWNHALSGREYAGSVAGRTHLLRALAGLKLDVPTASLPHQLDGLLSIDHVATPSSWTVVSATRRPAFADGVQISDHDAYVIEVIP